MTKTTYQNTLLKDGHARAIEHKYRLDLEVEELAYSVVEDEQVAVARVSHTFGRLVQPNAHV